MGYEWKPTGSTLLPEMFIYNNQWINKEVDREILRMRRNRMTREMEYAKCIAVLCRIYRKGSITESEFRYTKGKLKDRFMIVENTDEAV